MSTVPADIGQVIGAAQSHFYWVKKRIIALNSQRTIIGINDAMDWPPKQFLPNTFYMLPMDTTTRQGFGTPTSLGLANVVQWNWMAPGDDLASNQRGRNRADRFLINQQMVSEIMYGLYPYFCDKQIYKAQDVGGVIKLTGSTIDPPEQIWWTYPRFLKARLDDEQKSGILYSIAQVTLNQFGDSIYS